MDFQGSDVGKKFDSGKLPWHLFPWDSAKEVVKVLELGAEKYGERNWEQGMKWSRLFNAAQRHLVPFFQEGENLDPDTQICHLAHAICCLMFMHSMRIRNIGTDDRPVPK